MYYLMNKNNKIARLKINNNVLYIDTILSNIPGYIGDITNWVYNRLNPVSRHNIAMLLKYNNINSIEEYVKYIKAISVNDTLWIKSDSDTLSWENISPYTNRLSRLVSQIALDLNYIGGNIKSPSPDYKIAGITDKCIKRVNNKLYLYKTDGELWSGQNGKNGIRPYIEYYAHQITKQLVSDESHYAKYNIKVATLENDILKPYAISELFTTEDYGYIELGCTEYKKLDFINLDRKFIGNDKSREILREMLVLDSITANIDRHTGNYGFIINNNNFKILNINPIFDLDCSLGSTISIQTISMEEFYNIVAVNSYPKTLPTTFIKQGKIALTDKIRSNLLNMYPFHFDRLPENIDISTQRIQYMEYIVNKQIKAILGR